MTSQRDLDDQAMARSQLAEALALAVPLWILEWREARPEHRIARAQTCGQIVAHYGDQILYKSKGRRATYVDGQRIEGSPGTASAFNRLAEGIACAAFQPGGVTVFGRHWEADDSRTG